MGDLIPFPSDIGKQLDNLTEQLPIDAAALQRQSYRAVRAAEELLADIVTLSLDNTEPDPDDPAA